MISRIFISQESCDLIKKITTKAPGPAIINMLSGISVHVIEGIENRKLEAEEFAKTTSQACLFEGEDGEWFEVSMRIPENQFCPAFSVN